MRIALLLVAALLFGCSRTEGIGGPASSGGTGGWFGSGGVPGSGGATESGGAPGTGGTVADASSDGALESELAAAMAQWTAAKPGCPVYSYTTGSSSFTGYCEKTTIEIANDQPVRRSYLAEEPCGPTDGGIFVQWDEVGAQQIGSHTGGAAASTVEQVFSACQSVLARGSAANKLFLTIGPDGVPSDCAYTPNQCVDDCTTDVGVGSFTCLALDAGTDARTD
jgi:hypothetical protein